MEKWKGGRVEKGGKSGKSGKRKYELQNQPRKKTTIPDSRHANQRRDTASLPGRSDPHFGTGAEEHRSPASQC